MSGLLDTSMRLRLPRSPARYFSYSASSRNATDRRASDKLFADAAVEERSTNPSAGRAPRIPQAVRDNENWTGDERIEDTVLRMLVDKYKPLRTGTVRTAEERLHDAPPAIVTTSQPVLDTAGIGMGVLDSQATTDDAPTLSFRRQDDTYVSSTAAIQKSVRYSADTPLIPAVQGHRPWHTTYKAPSHATSSVKYGAIPISSRRLPPSQELDDKARRKEREAAKRMQTGVRLTQARESMLDYKLGMKQPSRAKILSGKPNPASMKGWIGLVEDRIERARQAGHFQNVKGRGQPLKRTADEGNPFIGREEFLMNRIVQRQGAAPPWVEIQGELELAATSFREVLRQSWIRRAVRMLSLTHSPDVMAKLTLGDVQAYRDDEWTSREFAYHTVSIDELNALVRKYNGMAPYAVRRPYYILKDELDRTYRDAGEGVLAALAEGRKQMSQKPMRGRGLLDTDGGRSVGSSNTEGAPFRIWDVVLSWFKRT